MNNMRNIQIDFLRGLAILAVMILHFNISYALDYSALTKIFSASFIRTVASNGNYGVTIFFVISGFLITSTSLARYGTFKKIDPIEFYTFRFSRIMPCLLLAIGIIAILNFFNIPIFKNSANSTSFPLAIFSVITFWHNVLMEKIGYFNYCLNILWSLSVEEAFYLLFPLLCLMFKRTRFMLSFWIILLVISPIYRSYYANNEIVALYGYISCFDAIGIGCIAAVIARHIHLNPVMRNIFLYSAAFFMASIYLYDGIMANIVIGPSIMAISAAIYLIGAINTHDVGGPHFITSFIGRLGRNSYELYLFHIIVLALMKEIVNPEDLGIYSKLAWFSTFILASVLVSEFISSFFSQPMNRKIREFLHRLKINRANLNVSHEKIY